LRAAAVLAAVVVAVAFTTTVAGAASSNEPKKVIKPAVQARAKRIAVNVMDLPGGGWGAQSAPPPRTFPSSLRCSYYKPDQSRLTENGDYTVDYSREDGLFIASRVSIFVSAKQARASYAAVVQPLWPRCLGERAATLSKPPGSVRVRSAGPRSFPRNGERSAAFRIVFDVKSGKKIVSSALDLVAINRGAVNVTVLFGAPKGSVSSSVERRIARRLAARMDS
jgi:hypothetical protein